MSTQYLQLESCVCFIPISVPTYSKCANVKKKTQHLSRELSCANWDNKICTDNTIKLRTNPRTKGAYPPHDAPSSLKISIALLRNVIAVFHFMKLAVAQWLQYKLSIPSPPLHLLIKVGNKCLDSAGNFDFLNCNQVTCIYLQWNFQNVIVKVEDINPIIDSKMEVW